MTNEQMIDTLSRKISDELFEIFDPIAEFISQTKKEYGGEVLKRAAENTGSWNKGTGMTRTAQRGPFKIRVTLDWFYSRPLIYDRAIEIEPDLVIQLLHSTNTSYLISKNANKILAGFRRWAFRIASEIGREVKVRKRVESRLFNQLQEIGR